MSLIYDYLKILGHSGLEADPDVKIPSTLKRRYANRPKAQFLLLLLGSCLIGALFLFLVSKISTTDRVVPVAVVTEPVSQAKPHQVEPVPSSREADAMPETEPAAATEQVGLQKFIVVPEKHKPVIVDARVRRQIVENPAIEQGVIPKNPLVRETGKPVIVDARVRRQIVESPAIEQGVIPKNPLVRETGKPVIVDARVRRQIVESPAIELGAMRQKSVQLPVLKSTKRKIAFPQNIPVYHESQEVTEDITPDLSGSTAESSAADAKFHAAAGEGPAVEEKSGKFYQAGLQAQYKGDGRIAEIYYKKALEELPHHMDAMINLSALYVQQGRYAEAERILAEIIAIEPANSKALVNMGMVSLYQDNEALAATQFEAALAANPREENALVNLAYLAEKNRDYPATEGYYRQLMQIAPENLEVLLAYGHLLEEQRRYSEAMALYADSLALGPVKKDRQLYNKISDRIRLLAGALKNSQP